MARKQHAIGLSKKVDLKVDPTKANINTISVFADLNAGTAVKAYLSSSSHFWDQPTSATVATNNVVTITAYCLRRKSRRSHAGVADFYDGDDDLTVTLVYDEGGHEETDDCTFEDVEYDH